MSSITKPRILYVSEIIPQKPRFGAELRSYHIARALQTVGVVEVAHIRTGVAGDRGGVSEFPVVTTLEAKPQPNSGLVARIKWTFNPRTSFPWGAGIDAGVAHALQKRSQNYDLVWFFKLRAADMFPFAEWSHSMVDIDDLPSTYERALLQVDRSFSSRISAMRRMFAWKRRERLLGARFSALAVCSEEDKVYLEGIGVKSKIHVIPNGFEPPKYRAMQHFADLPRFGFVGLMDFYPNRNGIEWFLENCWAEIKKAIPTARLRIMGQDSENWLSFAEKLDTGIDRLGWVADPTDEMRTWSAMIVPIRVGAGTRVKIAHGFSQGVPIVSTTLGAFGYGVVDGRELYLADSPKDFSAACVRVVRNPEAARRMTDEAWTRFVRNWTWEAIESKVQAAAEECLRNRFDGSDRLGKQLVPSANQAG